MSASILNHYNAISLPPCPRCGSTDTAKVIVGLVSRTIAMASETRKVKLLPNGDPNQGWCHACETLFPLARPERAPAR